MGAFPYPFRGGQESLVNMIKETVQQGKLAVIESGTGTGKTVASLYGALEAVNGSDKKIIYLTRTNSQQKQIISEVSKLSNNGDILCIGLQGRNSSNCPLMAGNPNMENGTPEEMSRLCSELKRKEGKSSQCIFNDNLENTNMETHLDYVRKMHPEPEDFAKYCVEKELCPYELVKRILPHADVIAAPYSFVFMPHILKHFSQWIATPISESVIIVDEAHNLPSYLRDVMTYEYSARALELTENEADEWDNPKIYDDLSVKDVTLAFKNCMDLALSDYLIDDDGLLPLSFLQDEMMSALHLPSQSLKAVHKGLMDFGEIVAGKKKKMKKLPRTYIGSFGRFLSNWTFCDEETHVSLIIGGENPKIQAFCLDPCEAARPLRECFASINMSGTLEPLSDYSLELDLINSCEQIFESPFPPENFQMWYVNDITTRYEEINAMPEVYEKLKKYVIDITKCVRKNTAVFFPSYALMDRFIQDGVPESIGRDTYYERRDMLHSELMEEVYSFRTSEGSVLFAVTGGRVSEGLDFPDKDLELAILVGVPYPKPTLKQDALKRYCEYQFGDGWEHAVKIPTIRKMRQAAGRLIRSDTDRGMVVILDYRISSMKGINAKMTMNPCKVVEDFFLKN